MTQELKPRYVTCVYKTVLFYISILGSLCAIQHTHMDMHESCTNNLHQGRAIRLLRTSFLMQKSCTSIDVQDDIMHLH